MSGRAITRLVFSAAVIAPDDLKCCRRSDLPLYVPPPQIDECKLRPSEAQQSCSFIEDAIRSVRMNISSVCNEVKKYENMGNEYIKEGVESAQWLVDYLGDEENPAPKGPAIAIGGLTGFIFGLRGGFFKKIIYTSIGALGMASVCFPKEAKEYGTIALDEGHNYATIAYNFIYGVKKGDTPLQLPQLPKLPSSASEVLSTISEFVSTTTASLTDQSKVEKPVVITQVRKQDPCEWIEAQKRSGAYRELASDLQELTEDDDDAKEHVAHKSIECECEDSQACQPNVTDVGEDDSCPCHLGSCMHQTDPESCPATLPYPEPTCPETITEPDPDCN